MNVIYIDGVKRLSRNANVLAGEEVCRWARGRCQIRAALIERITADLPIMGDGIRPFGKERRLRNVIGEVEGQRERGNLLARPQIGLRIKEVLPGWTGIAFRPSERAAGLEAMREALGGFQLERIVLGIAGRGPRRRDCAELRERIKRAL